MRLHLAEMPVAPLINGAVAATSALWRPKGLLLESHIPEDTPAVWGDHDRLSQVMLNLLSNATKFTDSGSITTTVTFDQMAVTVAVEDTGRGIPPDEVNSVFEKFRQVEGAQSGRPLGTGLGLPICRELIHLHDGRIWVESSLGKGTTFFFTVPRADAPRGEHVEIRERTSF